MSERQLGIGGRPYPYNVRTTSDHWWPTGVQRLWVDTEGTLSRISPNGEVKRKKVPRKRSNKGFADKRGGHKVVFGVSPWNHTFEPDFQDIDDRAPRHLRTLESKLSLFDKEGERLLSEPASIDTLVKFCFSLLIRSPAFRYRTAFAGASFGLPFDEDLGKHNMEQMWKHAKEIDLQNCNAGNVVLLHSRAAEFVFADGLYDNLFLKPISYRPSQTGYIADLVGDALVPLLPNVCAYLSFTPAGLGCNVLREGVSRAQVTAINEITQIYAKENVFYRAEQPTLTAEYARQEHMAVKSEKNEMVSRLRSKVR